jgi:hypothetical protein
MTLVEVLVVIAIIGVLVGFLLPAVQMTREAARRSACNSNLRQLALGSLQHEHAHGFLPSGGWGGWWVGDPDRGFDQKQTGGWAFNLLPFVEQAAMRDLGTGMQDAQAKADKISIRLATPVPTFTCVSRRASGLWPYVKANSFFVTAVPDTISRRPASVARGDYAGNMGSGVPPHNYRSGYSPQPALYIDQVATEELWTQVCGPPPDGTIFRRSRIRLRDVTDGTTCTYLFGEKYIDPVRMKDGSDEGDDQTMYSGHDRDSLRVGCVAPYQDLANFDPYFIYPSGDTDAKAIAFGSAHPSTCGMAMVDGSVRTTDYQIAPLVHQGLAARNDGQP